MKNHEYYMARCLELAQKGAGFVALNPMVGAVLVYDDLIIGEGYHEFYGGPHAEVNCLNAVKSEHKKFISDSTLYVSLEPCSHFGKTPPCTNLIVANKIPKVVVGVQDPFAEVNGSGISFLKSQGVEVINGVLQKECEFVNRRFFTFHKKKRPYVILKWAESAEGLIANDSGTQQWLSGVKAKALTHQWRAEEAAILVGFNTAIIDNPRLTNRSGTGKNPLRIVIDLQLQLPSHLHLMNDDEPTLTINFKKDEDSGVKRFVKFSPDESLIGQILSFLHKLKIQSLIVEGGAVTLNAFINEGFWDEARVFKTKKSIESGKRVMKLDIEPSTTSFVGEDELVIYYKS